MIFPDTLPAWLALPVGAAALVAFFIIEVRHAVSDPYDELTGLDVLERTGKHPG